MKFAEFVTEVQGGKMDESISLRELVDVDIIQSIQDRFAKTVGVSSVIFLPDGDALTRFSNPTEFCSLIRSTKEGRRRCFQSFTEMNRKAAELSEPEIMYCFAYGAHFVAPIIIDGERKATMYAGQFRPEKFSPEQLKELEKIAVEIDLDPELLAREAKNMRTVKDKVVWACLNSFFRTVKVIAELGAQAFELRQTKDALQNAHDGLEMRVRERTAELIGTNEELRQEIAERKAVEDALRESEEKYRTLIENVQDGLFLIQDGKLKFVNEAFARISGYPVEEILGMGFRGLVAPEDRAMVADRYVRMMAGEDMPMEYEFHGIQKNGDTRTTVYMTIGLLEYQGKPAVIGTLKDITGQKRAEQSLQETEAELKHIIEVVPGIIVKVNAHTGYFTYCNPALSSILGFSSEEFLTRPFIEFIHPDDRQSTINEVEKQLKGSPLARFENRYICKNGSYKWLEWRATAADEKEVIYAAATDITERKRMEEELRLHAAMMDNVAEGVYLIGLDDLLIKWTNEKFARMFGYGSGEMVGKHVDIVNAPTEKTPTETRISIVDVLKETGEWHGEVRNIKRDGTHFWCYAHVSLFDHPEYGKVIVSAHADITERKRAEDALRESEEKFRSIAEQSEDGIVLVDEQGTIIEWNPGQERIAGLSRAEVLGRPGWDVMFQVAANEHDDPAMYERIKAGVLKILETGQSEWLDRLEERVVRRPDGARRVVQVSVFPIKTGKGFMAGAISRDITERKAAEEQIKRSLREKDVLMREMHHRAKNNLQVVSSLLSMQARTTQSKEAIDVLSKSQSRINTMALIHTQLYESGDLSELNMKEFVGTLSEELFRSYPVNDTKISRIVHVTDRKFPASVGVHVGLIINELLGNALQHAFGERKEGKIEVSLTTSDSGRVNLRVSDDGVGLPPGFDIDKTRSLGLHLVKILVEDQLQGKIEVISDGGATFNMEFDIECNGGSSYGEDKNTDR